MFGTLSILRFLLAPNARHTYRAALQSEPIYPASSSRLATYSNMLITFTFIYGCSAFLLCGGVFFVQILFWGNRAPLGGLGITVGLFASMLFTSSSVYRSIRREQTAYTWDLLLLLPYPREQVILRTAAQSHKPIIPMISLVLVVIAARQLADLQFGPLLLFYGLLAFEWLQLTAFHVAGGLALANSRRLGLIGPPLLSLSVIVVRACGGVAVAQLFSLPTDAALLLGPLSIGLTTESVLVRAIITLVYLLLLELGVRFLFAWAVARAGEI
ncbi:MAG TPA: hypothetical protein VHP83_01845 [Aggregatilineaceae bacterium]|nr:hypothetical protein [Aggregatilineaceae bacterium]